LRNRIQLLIHRTTTAACVLPVIALTTARVATADTTTVESRVPVSLDGFAVVAILLGFGGLIAGLVRHRRRLAQEAKAAARAIAAKAIDEPSPSQL
jgi:hypothetical protein